MEQEFKDERHQLERSSSGRNQSKGRAAFSLLPNPCSLFPVPCSSIISSGETIGMASLEGKTALVTGASQGIGRACAIELAKAGARIALAARNESKLADVAAEIAAAGRAAEDMDPNQPNLWS